MNKYSQGVTDGSIYHLSSTQKKKEEDSWLPQENENQRRPEGPEEKKGKGKKEANRLNEIYLYLFHPHIPKDYFAHFPSELPILPNLF